jgi:hypothetical protein
MSEPENKTIALFVLTAGRTEYLDAAIKSINKNLKGNIIKRIIFDNSDDHGISYDGYDTVSVPSFGLPYSSQRHSLVMQFIFDMSKNIDADAICFFEEDWELLEEVDLDYLSKYLNERISQIRLFRKQDYNVAGIIHDDFSVIKTDEYMFTLNPSLFSKKIMQTKYPVNHDNHEWRFGQIINKPFMVYKNGTRVVGHIGEKSITRPGELSGVF